MSTFSRRPHGIESTAWSGAPAAVAACALLILLAFVAAPAAHAASGGLGAAYSGETVETPTTPASTAESEIPGITSPSGVPTPAPSAPGATATLVGERAVAPASAPAVVKQVIAAANRIRSTPYIWGGGHARWWDKGYDCSGSVSYALHGAKLLEAPLVSGSFMTWGEPGPGAWITIYANQEHVYMTVAGLRWDTGGDPPGVTGPRWHSEPFLGKGFVVRHPVGY
ncbi:MAG: C40 family peptidase [Actinobacteria bacterium]|nr:C40 family peptidase [Actinomycetota bacterium]